MLLPWTPNSRGSCSRPRRTPSLPHSSPTEDAQKFPHPQCQEAGADTAEQAEPSCPNPPHNTIPLLTSQEVNPPHGPHTVAALSSSPAHPPRHNSTSSTVQNFLLPQLPEVPEIAEKAAEEAPVSQSWPSHYQPSEVLFGDLSSQELALSPHPHQDPARVLPQPLSPQDQSSDDEVSFKTTLLLVEEGEEVS